MIAFNRERTVQEAKAFPSGEGGSRISRKRETDEGILGRCGHRPLQTLTMVLGSTGGLPHKCSLRYGMTATGSHYHFDSLRGAPLVRNDMHLTELVRNDLRHFKRAYCSYDRRSLLIPQRKTGDFLGVFPIEKGKWVWYTDSRIWKKKVFL